MINATELRKNVYNLLDEVLATGVPIEIERHGRRLRLIAVEKTGKLKNLKPMKNLITGDPAELNTVDWTNEWQE
jgi:antitoxin (DNA-binding transcriptional repressor) of toxin-antitoxin stability system